MIRAARKLIAFQNYSGREALFRPQLVDVAQRQDIEYVTLSHCWGAKQIITTTKETLQSRLAGISWKDLSKTFQDAIIITNNLGYRYIWIDSMCIIQNDHQDWELESKNMGSIYQNSVLTIAAGRSKDGDGGCFTTTTDLPGKEVLNPYTKSPTGVFCRRQMAHSSVNLQPQNDETGKLGRTDWPLSRRAWTFQEELLSSRLLYYGPEELVWQCNTRLCCQCGTINPSDPNVNTTFQDKTSYALIISSHQLVLTSARDHQISLQIRWYKLVQGYASRLLTKESDRLPALSGLMKQIQAAGLAPLVAGIPANNAHPWLLWKPLEENVLERMSLFPCYTAPSWSWLSCLSGNRLLFQDRWLSKVSEGLDFVLEPVAQILDITVEPAGLDPTGALKSGRLVLYSFASSHILRTNRAIIGALEDSANRRSTDLRVLRLNDAQLDYEGNRSIGCSLSRLKLGSIEKLEVLCVLISRIPATDDDGDKIFGLIVMPVKESKYKRIGTFECFAEKSSMPWEGFKLQEITII